MLLQQLLELSQRSFIAIDDRRKRLKRTESELVNLLEREFEM
jgi:hypothetical protein